MLGVAGFSQLALSCAPPEDATPPAGAEERSAGVYRGTVVSDVDAMDAWSRRPWRSRKTAGTFIGPNWILTARHCVFDDNGQQESSAELWIGNKDAPSWQGRCAFTQISPISDSSTVSWPVIAKKPSPVIKAVVRRPFRLPLREPGCRVLVPENAALDVALIDLNGIPAQGRRI